MDKFSIKCPECDNVFNLTINRTKYFQYFNEIMTVDYSEHTKLECPKCGYYETDKKE